MLRLFNAPTGKRSFSEPATISCEMTWQQQEGKLLANAGYGADVGMILYVNPRRARVLRAGGLQLNMHSVDVRCFMLVKGRYLNEAHVCSLVLFWAFGSRGWSIVGLHLSVESTTTILQRLNRFHRHPNAHKIGAQVVKHTHLWFLRNAATTLQCWI